MLEILLASHITQLNELNHPARRKALEDAYYRAGPDMAKFGRIARLVVACVLVTPLVALLADYFI